MKIVDKFLLVVALLALLALSLFLGCVALSVVPITGVAAYLNSLTGLWVGNALLIGAVALVLFVLVIRLFFAAFRKADRYVHVRLAQTEHGEVAIAIPTIKQIVAAFVATNPDIAASSSVVLPQADGLSLRLRVCPKEGVALPALTTALQADLKNHLTTVTGVPVKEIGVLVDNNRNSYSGKE